jgi:hypothetical protein
MYRLKIFKCVQFFVNHPVYHLTILYSARHGNTGCFGRNLPVYDLTILYSARHGNTGCFGRNLPVYHLTILYSARHGNTGWFGRNLPYFANKFLRLMYSDITKHTYVYPRFNSNGDNDAWKMWSSCNSTYWTCLICCFDRTLRRPSLRRNRSQAIRRRVC